MKSVNNLEVAVRVKGMIEEWCGSWNRQFDGLDTFRVYLDPSVSCGTMVDLGHV